MKIRLKLNPLLRRPAIEPGDRRFWLLGVLAILREERVEAVWRLEFFWRRFLAFASVLSVCGYLGAATALWYWFHRTPQNKVTWASIALAPVQREHFRVLRGETAIAVALERLKNHEIAEGFHGLRAGLARAPGNVEGRLVLAGMMATSDPARALATLEIGLRHAANHPELLRALFAVYLQQQAAGRALERAQELLGRQPPLVLEARRVVEVARVVLLAERQRFEEAEQALAALPALTGEPEENRVAALRVDLLIRRGRFREAQEELTRVAAQTQAPDWAARWGELAIAQQNELALEGALRRWRAALPDDPPAYLYAFCAWHRMKRTTLRDRAEQEYYQLFGTQETALLQFADAAASLGLPEVVQRAQEVARGHGFRPTGYRMRLTEMALRRGDFETARRHLGEWERQVDQLDEQQRSYPQLIALLAHASIDGSSQPTARLLAHLGAMRGRATPAVFALVCSVLELGGHPEAAREALAIGLRLYPFNDVMRAEAARFDTLLQKREAIAADRREAVRELESAGVVPATAEEALSRIENCWTAGALAEVRSQIRAIRAARPSWLADAEPVVGAHEVRLAALTQDLLAMRALTRAYLERHHLEEDALRLVEIAGQLQAQGRVGEARVLRDALLASRSSLAAVQARLEAVGLVAVGTWATGTPEQAMGTVEDALRRKDADHALFVIEQVRRAAPEWLAERRTEWDLREVRARLALDQRPVAFFLLRDLTLKSEGSREVIFRGVRALAAEGDERTALVLARELSRLLPADEGAAGLLTEIEAAPSRGN